MSCLTRSAEWLVGVWQLWPSPATWLLASGKQLSCVPDGLVAGSIPRGVQHLPQVVLRAQPCLAVTASWRGVRTDLAEAFCLMLGSGALVSEGHVEMFIRP